MLNRKYILGAKKVKAYNSYRNDINKGLPVCLAPYKSLRFMPEGNITVCCHNNSFVLGRYPEITPIEAWRSDKLKFLRKNLSKADFSAGCQTCFYAFDKQFFDTVNPLLYENYEINDDYPVILDFKIATECNLECIMCSEYSSSAIRKKNSNDSIETVYDNRFIESLKEIIPHVHEARFSGGEPFLNNIYYKIWELLIELNPECKIFIQTNGTLLNSKIKTLLRKGNFYINVSVDALNPELYAYIRRNADIETTINNIEYFAEYSLENKRKFGITACSMKDNVSEWADLVNFANKYNAMIWFSEVYFPFVNALWTAKSFELKKFMEELNKIDLNPVNLLESSNKTVLDNLIKRVNDLYKSAQKRENSKKAYIKGNKLKEKLKKRFNKLVVLYPDKWEHICNCLSDFDNESIYDWSEILDMYYSDSYVFEVFAKTEKSKLIKNFSAICK